MDDPKAPLLPFQSTVPSPQNQHFLKSFLTLSNFFILLGPILCTATCLLLRGLENGPRNMLAVLLWVFEWWLTEAIPMPITSMAPLFLFPIFGIASADSIAHSYMNDVIALVLGSFILVLAVEHYNIHRRLALNVSSFIYLLLSPSMESILLHGGSPILFTFVFFKITHDK